MASHASALKAHRQNVKRRARNRKLRSEFRGALKNIRAAIDARGSETRAQLTQAIAFIDRMVSKGTVHRNTAARHKSRLMKRLSAKSNAA